MPQSDLHECVVYHPPKSVAFGHQSRPRNPREAWPKVLAFLNDFTQFELSPNIRLNYYGKNAADSDEFTQRVSLARQLFGHEKHPTEPNQQLTFTWELQPEQLDHAREFAFDDDKLPKQALGSTDLHICYYFLWRDYSCVHTTIQHQRARDYSWANGWSSIGISFGGNRLFLQPFFVFPYHFLSPMFLSHLMKIEASLPFRIREQYFKRCLRTKKGNFGRFLKLDKNWRYPGNKHLT